jgi:putative MATE family efflux protein
MTKSPEISLKGIIYFSIPSIAALLLEPLAGVVDSALVGHKSTEWLAALAIATTLYSSFSWIFNFLVHVGAQKVADAIEKKKQELLVGRTQVVLISATILGLLSALFMYILRFPLYELTGAHPTYLEDLDRYFTIRLVAHPLALVYLASLSIIRAKNLVKISFLLILSSTTLNIVLSYLSLFVFNIGIQGVAWSTNISILVGTTISLGIIFKTTPQLTQLRKKLNWSLYFEFQKDSLNMFLRSASLTMAFWLATKAASQISVHTLSAHQILLQIWLFISFFLDGVAVSATILVAQNYSLIKIFKLKKVLKSIFSLGALLSILFLIVYSLGRKHLPLIFSTDPEVLSIVSDVFPVLLLFLIPSCIAYIFDGVLFGFNRFEAIRSHMLTATLFIYLPICLLAFSKKDLSLVWVALGALNCYRCFSGYYISRKTIKKLSFQA